MKLRVRIALAVGILALLSACSETFSTSYPRPVDPAVSRDWRLAAVKVTVPDVLVASESTALIPSADIVWHGDPEGDRKVQVAKVLTDGITAGASGLHGRTPVNILVTLERFHALSTSAEALERSDAGVHDIFFQISVVDAHTGAVLFPPEEMNASLPALTGTVARNAAANGMTEKSMIEAHLRDTVAGWLGLGPDVRGSFQRIGG